MTMDRIEPVKKILGEFIYRFRLTQTDTERENNENKAIKALETLYSEPRVCPKPKQMMICPKASEGNQSGYYGNANPEEYLLHGGKPLPPDELLKEIKELPEFIEYRDAIRTQHNHPFSIEYMRTFEAEDKLISAILLKCHQSEAARIKEIKSKTYCTYCGTEFLVDDDAGKKVTEHIKTCTKHPLYQALAKIEELEKQIHDMASGDVIREARAYQNKKIGERILAIIGQKPHLTPSWLVDMAIELKGEAPEGEK